MKTIINLLKDPELCSAAMDLVEVVVELAVTVSSSPSGSGSPVYGSGIVPYGNPKKNGSHNHTFNKGEDRTPAQKDADIRRRKS